MLIRKVLDFTIFIKNFIEFPAFNIKHKNMVDNLKPCIFNPINNSDCPIFSIRYIVNQAEHDSRERDLMLHYGGVIRVKLDWDCNLDRQIKLCKPKYSFARLDVPFRDRPFSVGFNFRFASQWTQGHVHHRTLIKAYGLRLIIAVSGRAGRFDFITLSLNIGSLVGVFGFATFVCDILLLHLSKRAGLYRSHVFESVHLKTRHDSLIIQPQHYIDRHRQQLSILPQTTILPTDISFVSSLSYNTPDSSRGQLGTTNSIQVTCQYRVHVRLVF
jgi:P2X purinoceptor 1